LDSVVFSECLEAWSKSDGHSAFWNSLAQKHGYRDGEKLRNKFKKERERRGINRNNYQTNSNAASYGNAKICVLDLELSPMLLYGFDLYDQNFGVEQIVSHTFLISWSAKMLNEPKVYSDVLTPDEALRKDDLRITQSLWELLNPCQVLIGHNIKDFDLKKLNVRLLNHRIVPLSKAQVVDTLSAARQNFSFASNSLKFLNKFLGIKQKIETEGFALWARCMDGDATALQTMDFYCQGDVLATEDLYFRLRPFIKGHPNLSLYFENNCDERCPNCGSENLSNEGFYYTPAGKWASMRCSNCGAVSRSKQNELDKEKRKSLLVN